MKYFIGRSVIQNEKGKIDIIEARIQADTLFQASEVFKFKMETRGKIIYIYVNETSFKHKTARWSNG